MRCTSPVMIQDKSTGGVLYVPCGRCMDCRLARARTWALRIMHEVKSHEDSCFVTLTYADEHLPKWGTLVKRHAQDFFRNLRREVGKPVRYFLGGEYGDRGMRPHYHICLFGCSIHDRPAIEKAWPWGFVHIGNLTFDSAAYVACYTLKKLTGPRADEYVQRGVIPEFSLMSRKPGIGAGYCESNRKFLKENVCCIVNGHKTGLPRFYRDKLFTEDEKAIVRSMASDFYANSFDFTKSKAGVSEGFEVLDYQKGQRAQRAADTKARQALKRRKL